MRWWLRDGILIHWDSEAYLAAAKTRQDFGALPSDYGSWSPLYPLLLSVFSDMLAGAKLLNVISFAFTGAFVMLILDADRLAALVVSALLIFSPGLQFLQQSLLSELVFIAFVLLTFYGIKQKSWIITAAAVSLACLQRYSGIALIPVGLVAVWFVPRRTPRTLVFYLIIAAAPIAIWCLRNLALGLGVMGVRQPGSLTWVQATGLTLDALLVWLPYLLVMGIMAFRVRISRHIALAAALFVVLHSVMVIYGAATTNLDHPNQRLLAPAYIPALLLAVKVGEWVIAAGYKRRAAWKRHTKR